MTTTEKVKLARRLIGELNDIFAELAREDIEVDARLHGGGAIGDKVDRVALEAKFSQVL
jgi:hypothetical protein